MLMNRLSMSRHTSYQVSPKETKTKSRRISFSKHLLTRVNIGNNKKMTRSLSSNTLKIVNAAKETEKISVADINTPTTNTRTRSKKSKNKQKTSKDNIQRFSPRRSSVPVSHRHRVLELHNSEERSSENMRRHSLTILSILKPSQNQRKGSASSAIEFWKFRKQKTSFETESGISSACSNDSIDGKKSSIHSTSGSDDASKEFSWSDSVLAPNSEEDDFKIYGEQIIIQDSDDDVFKEEPRRKSIDFNLILKPFTKRKTAFRSRSQTQGEIKVKATARRNTYDFDSSCTKDFITSDDCRNKMNKMQRRQPSLKNGKPSDALKSLLQSSKSTEAFRAFLQNEYSEENLDFWLDCQNYLSTSKKEKVAARIYETYLKTNAPREVNLDAETKAETATLMRSPNKSTFINAQNQIFRLMLNDSFRRFSSNNEDWLP